MMKAQVVLTLGTLSLGALFSAAAFAGSFEASTVLVTSYIQRPDYDSPWKKSTIRTEQHIGTVVPGKNILVSAMAVGYSTHIEMSRFGDSMIESMEVVFVDYSIGLALLRPTASRVSDSLSALEIDNDLKIGERSELLTNRDSERPLAVPVRLSDVDIQPVATSGYSVTHYRFEAPGKNSYGRSEPVITGGKLSGIAVGQADNVVSVIPSKVIRHFLNDRHDGGYRGFPSLGITVQKLDSPALRAWLGASKFNQGLLITGVKKSSPFVDKVQSGDILLRFGDYWISKSGYYQHPLWGPMHFIDYMAEFFGGDRAKMTIVRQGRTMVVDAILLRYLDSQKYIPDYRFGPEPHVIFGGLIFQELSTGFLRAWGSVWQKVAPLELVYLSLTKHSSGTNGDEKMIILNRVLADAHNNGYEDSKNLVLEKVNGNSVSSMKTLREALSSPLIKNGRALARFEFRHGLGEIILGYDDLNKVHERLARGYNITSRESFFSYPPQEPMSPKG